MGIMQSTVCVLINKCHWVVFKYKLYVIKHLEFAQAAILNLLIFDFYKFNFFFCNETRKCNAGLLLAVQIVFSIFILHWLQLSTLKF